MLKIRREQVTAMEAAQWRDFFARALHYVRDLRPELTGEMPDSLLRRLFKSSVRRAAAFGLETEHQIMRVFEATILLGDRFESSSRHDWAVEALRSRYLSADHRVDLVVAIAEQLKFPQRSEFPLMASELDDGEPDAIVSPMGSLDAVGGSPWKAVQAAIAKVSGAP